MSLLRFLGFGDGGAGSGSSEPETESVRQIVEQLSHMEPEKARYTAAFAYLLSRVAAADLHVSGLETRAMEQIVAEHAGLPAEQAALVVEIAQQRNRLFGATEDFLVTREFNRITTRQQKLALLDCLYAVCAAEGMISVVEDNEVRQIAGELLLEHRELVAVRSRYRKHLAVLSQPDGGQPGKR